jgi:hypothetical protein
MKVINYDKLTQREKLLYLAGVWDGEGSFGMWKNGIGHRNTKSESSFRMGIRMSDKDTIERFKNFFKYGNVRTREVKKFTTKGEKYKTLYSWEVRGRNAFCFVLQMYPFFCERRKKKFKECYIMEKKRHEK